MPEETPKPPTRQLSWYTTKVLAYFHQFAKLHHGPGRIARWDSAYAYIFSITNGFQTLNLDTSAQQHLPPDALASWLHDQFTAFLETQTTMVPPQVSGDAQPGSQPALLPALPPLVIKEQHRVDAQRRLGWSGVTAREALEALNCREEQMCELLMQLKQPTADAGTQPYSFAQYAEDVKRTAAYPGVGSNMVYPALKLAGEAGELADKIGKHWRNYYANSLQATVQRRTITSIQMRRTIQIDVGMNVESMDADQIQACLYELGDVLWYVQALAAEFKTTLEEVAHMNATKLKDRAERGTIPGEGDDR